jgi:hypothetical protein
MGIIEQCWLYDGYINQDGYGAMCTTRDGRNKQLLVHRVAYECLIGPIPEGLTIDHLCRVRHCYNPFHMEPVTNEENIARRPLKTHCPAGHEYNEENARRYHSAWHCRVCDRQRKRVERSCA